MLEDDALTAEDVAEALRISKNSVYRLAQTGDIASYRVGRKLRFTRQAVKEYIGRAEAGALAKTQASYANSAAAEAAGYRQEQGIGAQSRDAAQTRSATGAPSIPDAFALPHDAPFVLAGNDVSGDVLANALNAAGVHTGRAYVGSYTALVNLYAGQANAALVHLFDSRTNSYNVPFIARIAPGTPVAVIRILKRRQGFIVRSGNPKRITTWGSLLREGIRLANRSRGCATRVLLDEKLLSLEARPDAIEGYQSECATGSEAAALVASGAADVALGIERLAASSPELAFIPMQTEWLDLVVEKSEATKPFVRALKRITASDAFRRDIARLEGCEAVNTGAIVYEC